MKCFACESEFFGVNSVWNRDSNQHFVIDGKLTVCGKEYTLCPRCMRIFLLATAASSNKQPYLPITVEDAENA